MIRTALAILRKDLRIELRTKESVPAMALFSVTVFVLFHFGLDRDSLEGDLAAGVLWVTLLLAAVLGRHPAVRGRARAGRHRRPAAGADGPHGAVRGQGRRAVPVPACVLELVAVPAFDLLLLGPDRSTALPALLAILLLGELGLAAVGALVAALAVGDARARADRAAAAAAAARAGR